MFPRSNIHMNNHSIETTRQIILSEDGAVHR